MNDLPINKRQRNRLCEFFLHWQWITNSLPNIHKTQKRQQKSHIENDVQFVLKICIKNMAEYNGTKKPWLCKQITKKSLSSLPKKVCLGLTANEQMRQRRVVYVGPPHHSYKYRLKRESPPLPAPLSSLWANQKLILLEDWESMKMVDGSTVRHGRVDCSYPERVMGCKVWGMQGWKRVRRG